MPRIMKLFKMIGGKEFDLIASEFSEKRARRKAKTYRSMGFSVRVMEFDKNTQIATVFGMGRAGRKIFAVYVSHAKRGK